MVTQKHMLNPMQGQRQSSTAILELISSSVCCWLFAK